MRRLVLLAIPTLVGVVSAHAELVSASPAQGETVALAPTEVTLTFTEEVEVAFSTFKVYPLDVSLDLTAENAELRLNGLASQLVSEVLMAQGDEDARDDIGITPSDGSSETLILTLKDGLEPGTYVVMWRVLSVDTHSTDGFYTFSYAPDVSG